LERILLILSRLVCINSSIENTAFCQSLPASIFDIKVLDHQNSQSRSLYDLHMEQQFKICNRVRIR